MTGFNRLLTREVEGGGTVKNIIPLINNDDLEARFEIFARGANKLELPRVLLDPTKLVTFQDSLSRDKLLSLAKGIAPVRVRELPLIIEDNGKLFIWDGNHRAAISKLKGEKLEALLLTV